MLTITNRKGSECGPGFMVSWGLSCLWKGSDELAGHLIGDNPLVSLQFQLLPMLDVPTPQSSSLWPPLAPGGESMSHSPQNNSQNGGCPGYPGSQAAQGHWLRSSGRCRVLPHQTQPSPLSALPSLQLQNRRLTTASEPCPALNWGRQGWVLTSSRAACEGPKGCRPPDKTQSQPIPRIHSFCFQSARISPHLFRGG